MSALMSSGFKKASGLLIASCAIASASHSSAFAQTISQPSLQSAPPALPAQTPSAQQPVTPAPLQAPATVLTTARSRGPRPQGFSVVLVVADVQGTPTAGADDVPPAARKALTDMKDFLPYKSFKLLDAAWVMCCGEQGLSRRSTSASAGSTYAAASSVTQVLRGLEGREYTLRLRTSRVVDTGQVFVQFELDPVRSSSVEPDRSTVFLMTHLRERVLKLEQEMAEAKKRSEAEFRRVTREYQIEASKLAEAMKQRETEGRARSAAETTSVIDTTFTMDVGETVVVGASGLRGSSKALVALLTAVPARDTSK